MAAIDSNPMGTLGFEFVEFSAPDAAGLDDLHRLFLRMGFAMVGKHRRKNVFLYRQGDVRFVVNQDDHGYFHEFARQHGPCACAMAFRVLDARHAFEHAVRRGALPYINVDVEAGESHLFAVRGIGSSILYFVDAQSDIWANDFIALPVNADTAGRGLLHVDHLTHNVRRGRMDQWAAFYERIGHFREIRHFDIEGRLTGLRSRAMVSPCGNIRIPINESVDDHSQIEEYLRLHHGEGIQHIALATDDIVATVRGLAACGVPFMATPATYYERVSTRLPGHRENMAELQSLGILIDGDPLQEGVLLQVFTETLVGPLFFEIIQRKGNEGFGEGNFAALFDAMERDQIRRGVLPDGGGEHTHG
jgi:4-hydroxyphenylpyruvate dioxygenase